MKFSPILALSIFSVVTTSLAHAATEPARGVALHYQLPRAAQVSINIYDANGHVLRELLHAAPRAQGEVADYWDGLDADGKPVAAGQYKWKLLATQGLHAQYLLTLGTNNSPLYTPWPGNHGGVMSLASDDGGFYVGAGCGEATPLIVKQTLDGKPLWSMPHWLDAWAGVNSMASNGKVLYDASSGKLYRFNAEDGTQLPVWVTPETARIQRVSVNGVQLAALCADKNGPTTIDWLDTATGAVTDSVALPNAVDLKVANDGSVLAIADGAVVSVTHANKAPRTVVDKASLDSPWRLAIDSVNGDIIVAENSHPVGDNITPSGGQSGNQVKRFSPAGKLKAAYGAAGGRARQGRYDAASGFLGVYDIVTDGKGGFLTTEPALAPRRTDRWDREGKLVHEWYGGQMYANFACADPNDASIAWVDTHWGEIMQVKVDYVAKTWKVLATYCFAGLASGLVGSTYHGGGRWFVRHRDGVTYLARANNICVLRVDEAAGKLVACMTGTGSLGHDWSILAKQSPTMAALRSNPAQQNSYLWFDANGDGIVQPEEVHLYPSSDRLDWEATHDAHLDARALEFYRWARAGAPYYRDADAKVSYEAAPAFPGADNRSDVTSMKDTDGNLFSAFNSNGDKNYGSGWWGGRVGGNRVEKWGPDGKFQWVVGEHARSSKPAPGEAMYFWNIAGTTHGCVAVADCDQSYEHVWDGDGLWVGHLLDNPDLTVAPASAYELCGENFGSYLYTVPKTGEVLFFGGTNNSTNVYRVTGWDDFQRQNGQVTVTPEQSQGFAAKVTQQAADPGIAHFVYVRKPIKLNGDLNQFNGIKPLQIMDGNEVRAKVYLAWNPQGLYAAFDVNTDAPWKSSADTAQLAFQGGAAVDVNLGPLEGPGGANRTLPAAGDMRVVVSPRDKTTSPVEYFPVLPPTMTERDKVPATYETGQGKVTYDRVGGLPPAWAYEAAKPDDELTRTGYIVMMQIPMRNGMDLWPGERFRFDASVILANIDGIRTQTRIPWHSTNPADKMTEDTYYEALLRPADWGIAQLD